MPGNGVDDDGDGFVDDVHGANVLSGNGAVQDGYGHGTAMSGAAAAAANTIGVTGVAPGAKIMPVKVLADDGSGNTSSVIAGIRYAIAHGADVVNLSMNGPERSQALEETLTAAKAAGIVVVASAGNDSGNRDATPSYPASAPGDQVLPVAAESTGRRAGHLLGLRPLGAAGRARPGRAVHRQGRRATPPARAPRSPRPRSAAPPPCWPRPGRPPPRTRSATPWSAASGDMSLDAEHGGQRRLAGRLAAP